MSTDESDPRPSFDEVFEAVAPPGTDVAAFRAAFREAHRTGGHVPGGRAPDISIGASQVPDPTRRALPPPEPQDPFTEADAPSIAVAAVFDGLVAAGVPVSSAERMTAIWWATLSADASAAPPSEAEFDRRVADSINRLFVKADSAGYVSARVQR